jgi:hypothetical protein
MAYRFRQAHETSQAPPDVFFPQVHRANFGTRLTHSLDKVIQQEFSTAVNACSGT